MQMLRRLLWAALFVGALVVGWQFAAHNQHTGHVHYLMGELQDLPMWQILLGSFGLGVLVTGVLAGFQIIHLRLVARRYRKLAHGLESEIHQLRNLPLATQEEGAPRSSAGGAPAAGSTDRSV